MRMAAGLADFTRRVIVVMAVVMVIMAVGAVRMTVIVVVMMVMVIVTRRNLVGHKVREIGRAHV